MAFISWEQFPKHSVKAISKPCCPRSGRKISTCPKKPATTFFVPKREMKWTNLNFLIPDMRIQYSYKRTGNQSFLDHKPFCNE